MMLILFWLTLLNASLSHFAPPVLANLFPALGKTFAVLASLAATYSHVTYI